MVSVPVDTTTGFSIGDEVLIIQMQDHINGESQVGQYEFARITNIDTAPDPDEITLHRVSNTYYSGSPNTTNARVTQLVRVPQYADANIIGATVNAGTWSGSKGGILIFKASGTVTIGSSGVVTATGRGYQGGSGVSGGSGNGGESISGRGTNTSRAARDGGGGGGAGSGTGAPGGGGGSFATLGADGGWANSGLRGNTYGIDNLSSLYLGSGGGAGGRGGNCAGGSGGSGGGAVIIIADTIIVTGSGTIAVDGSGGGGPQCGNYPGGGGGGSGGSVWLTANDMQLGADKLSATGGIGGDNYWNWGGDGGAGGKGRIRLDYLPNGLSGSISSSYYGTKYDGGEPLATSVISKADSYGLGATATRVYGRLNGQTISVGATPALAWNHLVMTYDGSWQKLYLNGVLATSQALSGGVNINANNVNIGNGQSSYLSYFNNYFDGRIDEVLVYNRALDSTEIQERYNFTVKGANLISARANDNSGSGAGIQTNDQVIIRFDVQTNQYGITAGDIDSVLAVGTNSWLAGSSGISVNWQTIDSRDTLTITFTNVDSANQPTVAPGDTITLDGNYINDVDGVGIKDSIAITGSFSLPKGAALYWRFDEAGGNIALDSSGYNNDGAIYGASRVDNDAFGYALSFDGNDYVSRADRGRITMLPGFAMEAWVKPGDLIVNGGRILSKYDEYEMYWDNNQLRSYLKVDGGSEMTTTGTGLDTVLPGEWTHVAVTWDGAKIKEYINGSLKNSTDLSGSMTNNSGQGLNVGRRWNGSSFSNYYEGLIDEVVIYDRGLNAADIQARFDNSKDYVSHADFVSALASDDYIQYSNPSAQTTIEAGIQTKDIVVIKFDDKMENPPPVTDAAAGTIGGVSIDSVLVLSNGHSWLDGSGGIDSVVWESDVYSNDTLVVVLSTDISTPDVAIGDMITLAGNVIKNAYGVPVDSSVTIYGSFGLPAGAVAHWKFDETSGVTIDDHAGYGNDGTLGNNTTRSDYGKSSSALQFGDGDYVDVGDALDPGTNDMSVDFWIKTTQTKPGIWSAVQKRGTGSVSSVAGWQISGQGGVFDNTYFCDGSGNYVNFSSTDYGVNNNKWRHVAVTWDNSAGDLVLYLDGEFKETASKTGTPAGMNITASRNFTLGAAWDDAATQSQHFNGLMDDTAVYNRALSPQEVKARYESFPARLWDARAGDDYEHYSNPAATTSIQSSIQAGDIVVIRFDSGMTEAAIDAPNGKIGNVDIDTVLKLSNGHTWKNSLGEIHSSSTWTTDVYTNDTLIIVLTDLDSQVLPNVAAGDVITLDGGTLTDAVGRAVSDQVLIGGSFDLPRDVVGYWRFEEGYGAYAFDSTPNSNYGELLPDCGASDCPTWMDEPYSGFAKDYGRALNFDGDNEYVQMSHTAALSGFSGLTLELWVWPLSGVVDGDVILSKSGEYELQWSANGTGELKTYLRTLTANITTAGTGADTLPVNGWTHVVITWDAQSDLITEYINGTAVLTTDLPGDYTYNDASGLLIGARIDSTATFKGRVDEVAVYDRALTSNEIYERYTFELSAPRKPVNVSPAADSGGDAATVSLIPVLSADAYSDREWDTQQRSEWEISLTTDKNSDGSFSSPVYTTVSQDLTVHQLNTSLLPSGQNDNHLAVQTLYYWHARYQDARNYWSDWSDETSFTTRSNTRPAQPGNVSPGIDETNAWRTPTLVSSAFSDPNNGDTAGERQFASTWEIRKNGCGYDALDSGIQGEPSCTSAGPDDPKIYSSGLSYDSTEYIMPRESIILNKNTFYHWRVRHLDLVGDTAIGGDWSDWSDETSFETGTNLPPDKPTNVEIDGQPAGSDPSNVAVSLALLESNIFSDNNEDDPAEDYHLASQWQIRPASGSYGGNGSYDSCPAGICPPSAEVTYQHTVQATLAYGTVYYWQVRHQDSQDAWSAWSDETRFITEVELSVPAGAVGYWAFEEGSGNTAEDDVAGVNTGTIYGNPDWVTGKVGNALRFDGNNDSVDVGHETLDITGDITLEAWIRAEENVAHERAIITKDVVTFFLGALGKVSPYRLVLQEGTGRVQFAVQRLVGWNGEEDPVVGYLVIYDVTTEIAVNDNQWHHIVGVANSADNSLRLYVDNVERAVGSGIADATSGESVLIGRMEGVYCADGPCSAFYGKIDEVVIYNTALTPAEINTRYTGTSSPNDPPQSPVNQAPSGSDISLTPTLQASAIVDPEEEGHSASRWQIRQDGYNYEGANSEGSYNSGVVSESTSTPHIASHTVPVAKALDPDTAYYWRVQYQDMSGSWSGFSGETSFSTRTNQAPNAPTNTAPLGAAATDMDRGTPLVLEADAFSDPDEAADPTETQSASHWQISTGSNPSPGSAYSDAVYESTVTIETTTVLTSHTVEVVLNYGSTYWWHAAYRDVNSEWSPYSNETTFTTADNTPPEQPSTDSTLVSFTPTLTANSFSDLYDSHYRSQWEVVVDGQQGNKNGDGSYTSPEYQITTAADLESHTLTTALVNPSTIYYWHVRYQDDGGDTPNDWSKWSDELPNSTTTFTTPANTVPETPTSGSPSGGVEVSLITPELSASAFSDGDGHSHAQSSWRIRTYSGGACTDPVVLLTTTSGVTSYDVPADTLSYSSDYCWQVSYQDAAGGWSNPSQEWSFVTLLE